MKNIKILISSILLLTTMTGCMTSLPSIPTIGSTINTSNLSKSDYETFIRQKSYKLDTESVKNISGTVVYYSDMYNVDPKLVLALIARESSFRANAVSSAGAVGLGQLMPGTAKDMGVEDRYNPEQNIMGTVKYLNWLLKRTNGDVDKALASYNMGIGAVEKYIKTGKEFPTGVRGYVADIKYFHSMIS
ncbi:MAG: lytic transglycosylase domain-containing protein [Candidatus Sericytochromatia bacterium]